LKQALDKAWNAAAEQKKINDNLIKMHKSEQLDRESKLKEEYHRLLLKQAKEEERDTHILKQTITELRQSLDKVSESKGSKEEFYQQEIKDLQKRLAEIDARNIELQGSSADTTRPLLRQIEALNDHLSERQRAFTALENSLRARIQEEEAKSLAAIQAEEEARTAASKARLEITRLKGESERQMNIATKLSVQLEQQQEINQNQLSQIIQLQTKQDAAKSDYQNAIKENAKLKERLSKISEEYKVKEQNFEDKLNKLRTKISSYEKHDGPEQKAEKPAVNNTVHVNPPEDLARFMGPNSANLSVAVEKLKSTLEQKHGEIQSLQARIRSLEKLKGTLEDELVNLTSKNEELRTKLSTVSDLEITKKDLEERYLACLSLVEEKTEQVEELSHDLQDWKQLYKQQVSHLIDTIEKLESEKKLLLQKIKT